ncbi:MAG: gamma-glutamyltransferase [Bacillota bacterium]|nr:gamma-glutamyltransferase [Bacillota bacterium]
MGGIVVAPQPPAAEVGAEVLSAGGNAVDGAVAAVLMQAAADPFMCGIGGFGVAQVFVKETGDNLCVDFFGRAGSAARADLWADKARKTADGKSYVEGFGNDIGYRSIAVPGTVAGMMEMHRRWGSMPWAELVRPAERFLRAGYPLYQYIADYFSYPAGPPDHPTQQQRLSATPEMARIWLKPDGSFRGVGEPVQLPDYADTLARLADAGGEDFYRGEIAARIAADLTANGALATAGDLANYKVRVEPPVAGSYRGYQVMVPPPPSGGVTVLQMLNILEQFELPALGHNSPAYLDIVIRAMQAAAAERKAKLGDPAFVEVPVEAMVDKGWAAGAAAEMRAGRTPEGGEKPVPPGTTHLTVCDDDGNAVAVTHTLGMGSGVITKGLGFQYNNAMANFDPEPGLANSVAPGKARISAMSPTMAMKNGLPQLVLGSPGSNAIVNAIVQVLLNSIDFGMPPVQAVSEPRVHCEGGPVSLETRFLRSTAAALAAAGHVIKHGAFGYDTLQGRVQLAAAAGGDGGWQGASDPRRDGGIAARG